MIDALHRQVDVKGAPSAHVQGAPSQGLPGRGQGEEATREEGTPPCAEVALRRPAESRLHRRTARAWRKLSARQTVQLDTIRAPKVVLEAFINGTFVPPLTSWVERRTS